MVTNSSRKAHLGKQTVNNLLWSDKHVCIKHMHIKYTHTTDSFYSVQEYKLSNCHWKTRGGLSIDLKKA